MAGVPAGRLSLEIVAEVARLQQDMDRVKKLVRDASGDIARSTQAANDNLGRIGNVGRASRAGLQQLSFQLNDVAAQMANGTKASVIFAQQSGQVVQALQAMSGGSGRFAAFMGGPWGIAISLGVTALAALWSMLGRTDEEAKKAKKSTESFSDSVSRQKHSLDEVVKALREYNAQQAKSRELTLENAQAARQAARDAIEEARGIRQRLAARLEESRALESASMQSTLQSGGGPALLLARQRSASLEAQIADNAKMLEGLNSDLSNSVADVAEEMAKLKTDPRYAVEERFKKLRNDVRAAGGSVEELTAKYAELNRQQKAALDALDKQGSAGRSNVEDQLGRMVALTKQLFPGATITSTTGGKHVKGSDHYAGRAIDFVPAGGMGRFTTDEVEKILVDAGVIIRRNASGTKQLFGPGRSAVKPGDHDNHFHLAWAGGTPDPAKVAEAAKRAQDVLAQFGERSAESIARINSQFDAQPTLIDQASTATRRLDDIIKDLGARKPAGFEQMIADAQKAKLTVQDALVRPFDELAKSSKERAEVERLNAEGRTTEAEVLQTIIQMEQRLGTLTEERKQQIRQIVEDEARQKDLSQTIAINKQAENEQRRAMLDQEMMRQQLGVMSSDMGFNAQQEALRLLNVEHEKRIILLQADIQAEAMRKNGMEASAAAILAQARAAAEAVGTKSSLEAELSAMERLRDVAQDLDLRTPFGEAGDAIEGMVEGIRTLIDVQADYQKLMESSDPAVRKKAEQDYTKAKLTGTAAILTSSKKLFSEQSTAYKVITAMETVLGAIRLANALKSIAMDTTMTASSVANSTTRAAADQAAGASKIFSQLGVFAFPVVAAMIALLAGLGVKGGGGGGSPSVPSADDVQAAQGAGTLLGDPTAKSASIANSLELVAKNTNASLEYNSEMVRSLRSIDSGIGNLAASVGRSLGIPGGFFDTEGKVGTSGSSGFLGMFGSSTTKTLFDQGVEFGSASLADAIANGLSGTAYQTIEKVRKKSGFFGLGGGTKTSYSTTTEELDAELGRQVGLILGSLRDSVVEAAKALGMNVGDALDTFQVEIGKISFKDLSASEIEAELQAVFSKVGDQMAGFAVQGLEQFQKAGEGAFETLMRLAKDYMTLDTSLKSIGMAFGAVGAASIEARESLIELSGGLDAFVESVDFYRDHFLTEAERLVPIQAAVTAEMARLGLASVDTIEEFKAVVNGIDLTTEAGQKLFAALMAVAPAFYEVADAAAQLAEQRRRLEIELMKAQGNEAGALAAQRELELAAMDESLRALQKQVWAAQDAAKKAEEAARKESERAQKIQDAKNNLIAAYRRESAELEQTASKFRKFSEDLRAFRDSLFVSEAGGGGYRAALVELMKVGGLAAGGDEKALGSLQGVATNFLDLSKNNASSLQQYQRDVALVAKYLDDAADAADGQASIADQQLQQLKDQVGKLVDIEDKVQTVAEATAALNAEIRNGQNNGEANRERRHVALMDRVQKLLERSEKSHIVLEQSAIAANKVQRLWEKMERSGGIAVVTDNDTPLQVEVVTP